MKRKILHMESGSGGISYVSYFVAIVLTLIVFCTYKFRMDTLVAKEICENGLHVVESGALTVNHDKVIDGVRDDNFENELNRAHIITSYSTSPGKTTDENQQVEKIGMYFEEAFVDQFCLTEYLHPTGPLKNLCGSESSVLISRPDNNAGGVVKIYEPVYTSKTTKNDTGEIVRFENGMEVHKWEFTTTYSVQQWIEYDLSFQNNHYTSYTKTILPDTPILQTGKPAEGATIESTVNIAFDGLREVIATDSSGGFFDNTPDQEHYSVKITQAMDIVIANIDSRKK